MAQYNVRHPLHSKSPVRDSFRVYLNLCELASRLFNSLLATTSRQSPVYVDVSQEASTYYHYNESLPVGYVVAFGEALCYWLSRPPLKKG